ncbi:MAG: hypothetical protein GFH27_549297n135 [Chloroflexi bacterium AL-W]|nr:hypothetical protein [Chloroflexi bacterium AL-N1]NOK69011.1 hypothetical protein [Chloroflexi bacterium AL-N10]NOK76994.1 hypothetical protein [Chloroflexi bacterium AL-N5]NOK82618.1 hypothetical protein [Chloroflexi bacterium AL-W]NOK90851.1 hypothetical protein [Chloroflexi bacterium AL-N15]
METYHNNREDTTLVAQTLSGERESFTRLLIRYYPSITRLCQRILGSRAEAEDIAQEAALQAFLGLSRLQEPERFSAWFHAIAANLARMALRRRRIRFIEVLNDEIIHVASLAHLEQTPEDIQIAREIHDTIIAAIHELSAVNRDVVIGFYLEGYSYTELAEILGVPVSTIKGRLFKGRRQLKQTLAPLKPQQHLLQAPTTKERPMSTDELIEVTIESVRRHPLAQQQVVVLRDPQSETQLPIFIGPFEALSIALALQKVTPHRPLTHDLTLQLIEALGAQVQYVTINKLVEQTFYAEITCAHSEHTFRVDARPSDALSLVARTQAPIYVAREVLKVLETQSTKIHQQLLDSSSSYPTIPQQWLDALKTLAGQEINYNGKQA